MRKISLLFYTVAIMLMLGCEKNASVKSGATIISANITAGPEGTPLKINAAGINPYGTYQVINSGNNLTGEIGDLSLANGGTGDVAPYTGASHQKFRITDMGNGYFTIMNLGSGKYLQSHYDKTLNYIVIQSTHTKGDNQLWQIVSTGQNSFKAINKANGLAITAPADSGQTVTLAKYSGIRSQMWVCKQIPNEAYRDDDVVNFFHRTQPGTTVAFDQGNSIALSDGRVLWVAEDSYNGNLLQSNGMFRCGQIFNYHNSALLQPASHNWDPALTPNMTTPSSPISPLEIIKSPGDHNTTFSWPGVGIEVGTHVYMYCYESANGSTQPTTVLYDFTESPGTNWGNPVRTTPAGMAGTITYSEGMVKPGDGYVYVYGNVGVFLYKYMYVARFAESDPQTWTFWNGTSWQSTPASSQAATLRIGTNNVAQANTSVAYVNGKYVMAQMDLGYFCDPNPHSIYISTSSTPTGPWSAPKAVFSIEDRINGHICRYYTLCIHPELNNGKNELLLTYCLNYNGGGGNCSTNTCINGGMDPNYYQIKGVRVPYAEVGL